MIRIRLGAADLTRIRIAPTLNPFGETMAAVEQICRRPLNPFFGSWRQSLKGRLGPQARPLAAMYQADRPGLDLPTLVGEVNTLAEGVDALLSVRRQPFRAEIEVVSARRPAASWPWTRLDSDFQLRRELGEAITAFHAEAVGPHWPRIRGVLQAERAHQAQCLAAAGIDGFLAGLCPPLIEWRPPVLLVRATGQADRDLDLAGSGLIIVPSVFLRSHPLLATDLAVPGSPPRLIYPVVRDPIAAIRLWADQPGGRALAALLGPTRSAALEAIAQGCGTGELARRVGVSAAGASQHATVLRQAGLITTHRSGRAVLHALTPLGWALLNGEH